jgi:hypothetical protein
MNIGTSITLEYTDPDEPSIRYSPTQKYVHDTIGREFDLVFFAFGPTLIYLYTETPFKFVRARCLCI